MLKHLLMVVHIGSLTLSAIGMQGQQMKSFMLRNREFHPITDAEVRVNGVLATYRDGNGYEFPASVEAPFDFSFRHPDYQSLSLEARPDLSGDYFLARKGEEMVWLGMVPRPCLDLPDHLLVAGRQTDAAGKTMTVEELRAAMLAEIDKQGYEVVREQKLYRMDGGEVPFKQNMYLIRPAKGHACASMAKVMEAFGQNAWMEFAGPALLTEEGGEVISIYPRVQVYGAPMQNVEALASRLKEAGNNVASQGYVGNQPEVWVALEPGSLKHISSQIEKISRMEGVVEIAPSVYAFDH